MKRTVLGIGLFTVGVALGGTAVFFWREGPAAEEPPRVWEATLLLPVNDNRGRPFPETQWRDALAVLVTRFGGATLGEQREGCWHASGGRVQSEPVRVVVVSFERGRLAEFRRTVREVGRRLGQESMYVRLGEPRVEVVPVAGAGAEKDP